MSPTSSCSTTSTSPRSVAEVVTFCFDGYYKQTPVRLVPPHEGSWHVVVHLGGYAGRVNANKSLNQASTIRRGKRGHKPLFRS